MAIVLELALLVIALVVAALWMQDTSRNWAEPTLAVLAALLGLFEFLRRRAKAVNRIEHGTPGTYSIAKNADGSSVVEGEIKVATDTWGAVVELPPFKAIPTIAIFPTKPSQTELPLVQDLTTDSFSLRILKSTQSGIWKWRARGELLSKSSDA